MTYTWHFGDGTTATGTVGPNGMVTASHVYADRGLLFGLPRGQRRDRDDGLRPAADPDRHRDPGAGDQRAGAAPAVRHQDRPRGGQHRRPPGSTARARATTSSPRATRSSSTNQTPTGQSAIVFDGTGDLLQRVNATDTIFNLPTGSADRTIFVVVDYVNARGGLGRRRLRRRGGQRGLRRGRRQERQPRGPGLRHRQRLPLGPERRDRRLPGAVGGAEGQRHLALQDGALIDSDTHVFNTDLKKLVLGAEIKGAGEAQLKLGAVLIYDRAVTETERLQIEDFLKTKYITGPAVPVPPVAADDIAATVAGTPRQHRRAGQRQRRQQRPAGDHRRVGAGARHRRDRQRRHAGQPGRRQDRLHAERRVHRHRQLHLHDLRRPRRQRHRHGDGLGHRALSGRAGHRRPRGSLRGRRERQPRDRQRPYRAGSMARASATT